MSLILKQEPANTISTPPAGKSTLFVNDSSVMSVKSPDGNVTTFPTVQGANTQVLFNDAGALNGNANLVFNKTSATMTVTNLSVTGNLNAGDINVSSIANGTSNVDIIGASGNVTTSVGGVANVLVVTGTGANVTGTFSVSGNANVGNIGGAAGVFTTVTGSLTTASQPNITSLGTLSSVSVSGNANIGNIGTAGLITATGNLNAGNIITGGVVSATGNGTFGNVSATTFTGALSGAATSATTAGTVTTAAQPNITSVGTLTSLSVSGNVNGGNLVTAGKVYSSEIKDGNTGIFLSSGVGSSGYINFYTTGGDKATITESGNIIASNVIANSTIFATTANISGNVNAGNVSGTLLTGTLATAAQPNITSTGTLASLSVTGNVTSGNLVTGGILSVTGTGVSSIAGNLDMTSNNIVNLATPVNDTDAATKAYVDSVAQGLDTKASVVAATTANITLSGTQTIDGVAVTAGQRVLVKNQTAPADNGLYLCAAGSWTRTTDMTTWAQVPGAYVFVEGGSTQADTGWVCTSDAGGTIGVTAMTWAQFSGAGSYTAGTGLTLTGSVFSVNVAQTQITSVGTLTSLSVSGNITAGNVSATTFTGALSGAATTAGTVTTAAQGNITSVGTLTGLDVNGTVTAVNITANTGVFTGNGSSLSALNASNVSSGTLAQSRLANASVTLGSTALTLGSTVTTVAGLTSVTSTTFVGALTGAATTAGTVTTAAQSNITSVGTLTSLSVSGQITNGNITTGGSGTAGNLTGNWTLSAGSRLQATYADLAEKYVADATYTPGTVLVFGGDKEVTLANAFDSTRVAGVVTTNPAYSMNSACEGEHVVEIALQGRVPVKVLGPVYKGDLLVSGSNGHATANNLARAGTIIGKSLENFTDTIGTIEVAVGRF